MFFYVGPFFSIQEKTYAGVVDLVGLSPIVKSVTGDKKAL